MVDALPPSLPAYPYDSLMFVDAVTEALTEEGGYANDPVDRGKETNMGITAVTLAAAISLKIIPEGTTIKALTREQAILIYRKFYWDEAHCDELPEALAKIVFDWAIVSGPGRALKGLQQALYIEADGVWGPKTLGAARISGDGALVELVTVKLKFHDDDVAKHPPQIKFMRGWRKRTLRTLLRAARA